MEAYIKPRMEVELFTVDVIVTSDDPQPSPTIPLCDNELPIMSFSDDDVTGGEGDFGD